MDSWIRICLSLQGRRTRGRSHGGREVGTGVSGGTIILQGFRVWQGRDGGATCDTGKGGHKVSSTSRSYRVSGRVLAGHNTGTGLVYRVGVMGATPNMALTTVRGTQGDNTHTHTDTLRGWGEGGTQGDM